MQPARIRIDSIGTTVVKATRSVLILRLLAAVLLGVLAIVGWVLNIWAVPIFFGICSFAGIVGVGQAAVGAVYAASAGIRFRRTSRMESIDWSDIHQFVEISRPWGRMLAVERSVSTGMPVRILLPAPRTSLIFFDRGYDRDVAHLRALAGEHNRLATAPTRIGYGSRKWARIGFVILLLVVAPVDRPFGWFAGSQASTVPEACAALSDRLSRAVDASGPDAGPQTMSMTSCTWKIPDGTLTITYQLFHRQGLHSGSDRAAQDRAFARADRYSEGFSGLGALDPAAQSRLTAPGWAMADGSTIVLLTAAANVNVTVEMSYPTADGDASNVFSPIDQSTMTAFSTATNMAIAAVKTG